MNNTLPKVTFGFVNSNRLHYLKSCVESAVLCTSDYPNREFIIIDNASVEEGTKEYLDEKENQHFKVIRQLKRDPSNEFAKGLNLICQSSSGEFVVPLQGDMQFILKGGWLKEYVGFYKQNMNNIGCITLDAQRRVTIASHTYSKPIGDNFRFFLDQNRNPIAGAGDVMYSREIVELICPWSEQNEKHEGGGDSETKMLQYVDSIMEEMNLNLFCAVPMMPVSCAIYNEQGTNARVRGNRRYGSYSAPTEGFRYYEIMDISDAKNKFAHMSRPYGIEDIAQPIGWNKPLDFLGNWNKSPINPDTATEKDYVELE